MPPLCYYSIGDVLRPGAEGTYGRSSTLVAGYFIAAFAYLHWIPFPLGVVGLFVYWKNLFKNAPAARSAVTDNSDLPR